MARSNGPGGHGRDHLTTRWAIGLAAGGVLAGHGITYALVQPDPHARAGLLGSTGHAYLHLLEGPGLVLAVISVVAAILFGLGHLGGAPVAGALFRRLAGVQVTAFVAMELAERVGSGGWVGSARDAALLGIGVAVQLGLAAAGAWLLQVLHRGGERLARTLAVAPLSVPRPSFGAASPRTPTLALGPTSGPSPARGPPLSVTSV